jgi:hypothetical protein
MFAMHLEICFRIQQCNYLVWCGKFWKWLLQLLLKSLFIDRMLMMVIPDTNVLFLGLAYVHLVVLVASLSF